MKTLDILNPHLNTLIGPFTITGTFRTPSLRGTKEGDKKPMTKKELKQIAQKLQELTRNSSKVAETFGIDLMGYESGYIEIIQLLINHHFNENQVRVINAYLFDEYYQDIEIENGKMFIEKNGEEVILDLSTFDNLWKSLNKLK